MIFFNLTIVSIAVRNIPVFLLEYILSILNYTTVFLFSYYVKDSDITKDEIPSEIIDTSMDHKNIDFIEELLPEKESFRSSAEIVRRSQVFFQTRIVVLVETAEDVVAYQNFAQQTKGILIVVATTPHASWDLETKKIPYKSLDTYHKAEKIYNAGIKNYAPLFHFCQHIDRNISHQVGMNNKGLCPASDNFPVIKILYDALLVRTIILYEIIEQEKPELIVTFGPIERKYQSEKNSLLPFEDKDNIYHYLMGLEGWPCKTLQLQRYKQKLITHKSDNKSQSMKRKILSKIPNRFFFFIIPADGLIKNFTNLYYIIKNRLCGKKTLLLIGFAYDWNYMIPVLLQKGYRIYPVLHHSCELTESFDLDQSIIPDDLMTGLCCWNNINFSPIFNRIFFRIVQNSVSCSKTLCESWEQVISKSKPVAVLTSAHFSFSDCVPFHVAKAHKIPVLTWQHGAAGPHTAPIIFFEELMNTDIHLCWGTNVLNWIKTDPQNYFKTLSIAVGSYDLEKMYFTRDSPPQIFDALYVTSTYYGNSNYVSIQYYRTDTSLWDSQQKIIEILGDSNKKVKIRLSPVHPNEHIHDFIKSKGYGNLNIEMKGFPYVDLAKRSEVIIIDWPSTTLLQAIALRKTVFVLLKHMKLTDEAARLLKKRTYCSDNIEEFIEMIRRYFNNELIDQNPDINNTEYLEMYGTSTLDGHVANRALEILNNVIELDQ